MPGRRSPQKGSGGLVVAGWAYDSYSKTQNIGGESCDSYWGASAAYFKLTAIMNPSMTFAFCEDADQRNYNHGTWVVTWTGTAAAPSFSWVDPPAMYHGNVNTFAFTDGHVEYHRWLDKAIIQAGRDAANGMAPTTMTTGAATRSAIASTSGSDYAYVLQRYRFPGKNP